MWAVAGFFALSGFLIAGSRRRYRVGEYMVHRLARLYPAYLICLLVTILVLAPIAYAKQNGTVYGYLATGDPTPFGHLWGNLFLDITNFGIGTTLANVPYPGVWNGSLWTLYYEFLCYLMLAVFGIFGIYRRFPAATGACFLLSVLVHANMATINSYVGSADFALFASLAPYFLGGALVYMIQPKVPLSLTGALLASGAVVVLCWVSTSWGPQLAAPLIVYILLWLGNSVPSLALFKRHDISYGVYIYAFPAQQMLAIFGLHRLGIASYIGLSILATIPFAVLSWLCVERPVMSRVKAVRQVAKPTKPAHVP